jgi:hypothetical protein
MFISFYEKKNSYVAKIGLLKQIKKNWWSLKYTKLTAPI